MITEITFVLNTNSQSFIFKNRIVHADEKSDALKKLLGEVVNAVVGTEETSKAEKKTETTEPSKATDSNPTFQNEVSKLINQKVGLDDSGEVFHMGLTAEYTGPDKLLPGEGKYGKLFKYLPVMRWYDPEHYYTSTQVVEGEFKNDQCILCHMIKTPGIVAQWKRSKHATSWKKIVGCGFIGANFIRYLLEESDFSGRIINLDKLTYAGNSSFIRTGSSDACSVAASLSEFRRVIIK